MLWHNAAGQQTNNTGRRAVIQSGVLFHAFRQLSEAKQKTTRYVGGGQKVKQKTPFDYNKDVQAYCGKKGEMYSKPNAQSGTYQVGV